MGKPLFLLEDLKECNFLVAGTYIWDMSNFLRRELGLGLDGAMFTRNGKMLLCLNSRQVDAIAKAALERILKDAKWVGHMNADNIAHYKELEKFSRGLLAINPHALDGKALASTIEEFYSKYTAMHQRGQIENMLEMKDELFSNYLRGYLESRIKETGAKTTAQEAAAVLMTPLKTTAAWKEDIELTKIAIRISNKSGAKEIFAGKDTAEFLKALKGKFPEEYALLTAHANEFKWLGFNMVGPEFSPADFAEMLRVKLDLGRLEERLEEKIGRAAKNSALQEKIISGLRIDAEHKALFDIAREFLFLKADRKEVLVFSVFAIEPSIKEFASRFGMTAQEAKFLMPGEYNEIADGKKLASEARSRIMLSAVVNEGSNLRILLGKDAEDYIEKNLEEEKGIEGDVLKGSSAYPGLVKGTVKIVNEKSDMGKMNRGDVLVSHATYPDLVPAMEKAAAIVTDMGGITCHAAIVAREMRIPCVVGTKVATKVLKDGDLVEVNATEGAVKKLSE